MIDLPLLAAFVAAAALLTITPGVDTAMVLRTASAEGRRPAAMAAGGIALGCLIWGGAVALGLGAVLRASALAYAVMKSAGAAYLLWLGARLLWAPGAGLAGESAGHPPRRPAGRAFRRGFLTNLLNPKVGVFYVTFLPQFVPAGGGAGTGAGTGAGVAAYTFFLACVHVGLTLAWFAALILASATMAGWLRRPRAGRWLDRLTGGVFVGFGLKLAVSSAGR